MAVPVQQLWVPLFLRRRALLSFALLFALLAIAIGTLYHFSRQNQGLATPASRYRYFWTYVPSFTFTFISGFWFLVESKTKLLAPWRAIVERPDTLSHSLRLDYNDEFRYMTLFTSVKHAHWSVFLVVVGTFCLNILIVLSTGLLAIEQRLIVHSDAQFTLSTIFNATDNVNFPTEGLSTTHGLRYGLDFPNGTTATFAYQSLKSAGFSSASTARIKVDAFYPQVSCDIVNGEWSFGHVQNGKNLSEITPGVRRVVRFLGCERRDAWGFAMDPGFVQTVAGIETYSLSVLANPCDRAPFGVGPDVTFEHFAVLTSNMTLDGTNMSMTEARRRYSRTKFLNSTEEIGEDVYGDGTIYYRPESATMISSQLAGVVCTTAPKLGKADLLVSQGSVRAVTEPNVDHETELDRALGWQLQQAIYSSFQNDAPYLTGYNYTPFYGPDLSLEKYSAQDAPFFQLLNDTDTRKTAKDFIDADFLMRSVPPVLDRIAVQIAATDYFIHSDEEMTGIMTVETDRLVVLPLYLSFIIGILGIMTLITAALCIWSEGVITCDPATIAGLVSILAERPGLIIAIQELDHERDTDKTSEPDKHSPNVTATSDSEVSLLKDGCKTTAFAEPVTAAPSRNNWWYPWSALLAVRILVLLLPCAGIAVLEALLQLSNRRDGFAAVSPNDYVRYAWMHVPVLIIFCLNNFFDATSYTSRTIQPYFAMHRRPTPASRSIGVDLFHRTTLSALYKASHLGHLGVVAAIAATLLGWSLPITASGLFSSRAVLERKDMRLRQTTFFDPSASLVSSNTVHDNFLPLPGLILYNNLSYPRWTHGKYALPKLDFAKMSNTSNIATSDAVLSVELPAVYGVANCTLQNDMIWSVNLFENRTIASDDGRIMPLITLEAKTPPGCPPMPCDLQSGSDKFHMAKWRSFSDVRNHDKMIKPSSVQISRNSSAQDYYANNVLPAHCPQTVMCTARGIANAKYIQGIVNNNTGPVVFESGKLMHCSPYVEQEMVRLELSLPKFDIIPFKPPLPVAGTRRFFSKAELVNTADFAWYLPRKLFMNAGDRPAEFDHFFEAVFSGSKGIDPVIIADSDTDGMQALFDRIDEIYGTIVAQVYSEKHRFATPAGDPTSDLSSTMVSSSTSRM